VISVFLKGCQAGPHLPAPVSIPPGYPATTRLFHQWGEPEGTGGIILDRGRCSAKETWFCFAGLWRPMPEGAGEAFTLLTTEPGPDVAPIHDRQMVVLERTDWLAWRVTRPEAELLRPLPAGSLAVEQVR
jgi:hypothetical protein